MPSPRSASQTAPEPTASELGELPTPSGIVSATLRVTGSILVTEAVFAFSVQTKPSPEATEVGKGEAASGSTTIGIRARTAPLSGSTATTVADGPLAAQTALESTATSSRETPRSMESTSFPLAGAIFRSLLDPSVTHTALAPTATRGRAGVSRTCTALRRRQRDGAHDLPVSRIDRTSFRPRRSTSQTPLGPDARSPGITSTMTTCLTSCVRSSIAVIVLLASLPIQSTLPPERRRPAGRERDLAADRARGRIDERNGVRRRRGEARPVVATHDGESARDGRGEKHETADGDSGRSPAPPGQALQRRRGRRVDRRVLSEDRPLELAERRPRLEAELVKQRLPGVAIDVERIGLTTRPVQRQHQLPLQALAQRMSRTSCSSSGTSS